MKKIIHLTCDYCKEKKAVGVYAADHGPFSLAECEECLKHPNLRTIGNGINKWIRFGEKAFDEYKELNNSVPIVYLSGEYRLLRNVIENITSEEIEIISSRLPFHIKEQFIEKITLYNDTNNNSKSQ